ncbi:MAG: DUF3078 domain-containing protein [Bacteroidota bacterium]
MKKLLLLAFVFVGLTATSQTDTVKYWKIENKASLNFTQSYFSNWSAGGENTLATTGKFTNNSNYAKGKHKWDNWLDLALGYSIIGDAKALKTDDKIEFISSYGYDVHKKIYATLLLTFRTQFANGYNYKNDSSVYISKFMAPATVDIGPGMQWSPNEHFLVNFSPVTTRWIIVNDQRLADAGSFGLDPAVTDTAGIIIEHAKKVKTMFGAKVLAVFKYEIFENVNFSTKLELFSDYLNNPQNIDVNWQTGLTLKVNSWLNVNITTELIYDNDIMFEDADGNLSGPRTQFNENMQLGLVVQF